MGPERWSGSAVWGNVMLRYGSVCSGIEAATVAWDPLGWKPQFFSEIDKFPRAVLAHHYPGVPLHGDFTTIEAGQYGAIDLLVGGTPCQSFSVAGLRGGLDDERGNLALEFCRLARRLGPRWVVWENVPGVLSLDEGRAFASILGGLAECGYGLAYRVLDAQFVRINGFGRAVPQRRRRVFVVGCLGSWQRAAAVLFERSSLRGDPPPRREAGEGTAPALAARTKGGGGLGTDFDCDGGLVSRCLNAKPGSRIDAESETFVAFQTRGSNIDTDGDVTGTIGSNADRASGSAPCIAFSAKDHGADAMDNLSPTLRAGGFDKSHANAGVMPAIAFHARQDPDSGPVTHPLDTDGTSIGILARWKVRRLMPVECERLQGFPDGYTDIPYRGKPASDGPRYKAIGNSMAVNCMRWIGHRIDNVMHRT